MRLQKMTLALSFLAVCDRPCSGSEVYRETAVMDAVKATVETAGLSMEDVVSLQIFCTDLKLYETFNGV